MGNQDRTGTNIEIMRQYLSKELPGWVIAVERTPSPSGADSNQELVVIKIQKEDQVRILKVGDKVLDRYKPSHLRQDLARHQVARKLQELSPACYYLLMNHEKAPDIVGPDGTVPLAKWYS